MHLNVHIFTKAPTCHGNSIGNHDLNHFHYMDITMFLSVYQMMNKFMGATTINEDNKFMMVDVPNQFNGLGI
jgi:hypothetical protein